VQDLTTHALHSIRAPSAARLSPTCLPTISFRLTDDECRTLALRADREQRTVSQLARPSLRDVLQNAAQPDDLLGLELTSVPTVMAPFNVFGV
jgi:hypothetical protein